MTAEMAIRSLVEWHKELSEENRDSRELLEIADLIFKLAAEADEDGSGRSMPEFGDYIAASVDSPICQCECGCCGELGHFVLAKEEDITYVCENCKRTER